ncbi:hypothetical protein [Calothrix sp. NIES-2098]|uniref:hypothetical protein n=1 Tax=Calothrix sp. NIES-2098 TaxID=1954171 RepID=UPI000B60C9F5|nr:hypothetical protein NIES2098_41190 [Calothrix sp. NIES-2098]
MLDYLLPLLLVTPFIAVGAIAFNYNHSLLSLVVVLLGAIAGAISIALSGIYWLQIFHHRWMESQAAGFIFVPITLPICAYTGAVAGGSLAAILYRYQVSDLPSPIFQIIAIGFTIVLAGLIPSAIATISFSEVNKFIIAPIVIICGSVVSSWFATKLAYLFVTNLFQ